MTFAGDLAITQQRYNIIYKYILIRVDRLQKGLIEKYINNYIPVREALNAGLTKEKKFHYKDLKLVKKQLGFKQMLLKINLLRSLLESTLYGFKLLQDDKK